MLAATLVGHDLDHFSHSQHSSYLRCPKAYELERIALAPTLPAWWFIGGNVVHEVTEKFDRLFVFHGPGVTIDLKAATRAHLDELTTKEVLDKNLTGFDGWLAAGRNPNKQTYDWWYENAPVMVQSYVDWREKTNWRIAQLDGELAIEYKVNPVFEFGRFQGAIDRVFILPSGELVIADIKTSTSPPKEPLQLGVYANALEMKGFPRPAWGTYVMVKEGKHTPLVPLDKYTTPYLEAVQGAVVDNIKRGSFPPHVTDACRTCVVQRACYAYGGEDSATYDRLHPEFKGAT